MDPRLQLELAELERMLRRAKFARQMAICWGAVGILGVIFICVHGFTGFQMPPMILLVGGLIASAVLWWGQSRGAPDTRGVIEILEREHPELRHLLSAAAEQEPDAERGDFRYLQLRVINAVLAHPARRQWRHRMERRLYAATTAQFIALAAVFLVLLALNRKDTQTAFHSWLGPEITVTPGNTEVERGTSLVISARFGNQPPPEATLVLVTDSGKTRQIPMERHLADPVFGASLPEVAEGLHYRIEYSAHKTGDYKVSVFDYPALVRADALLRYPGYTGLTNKTIVDTRRVSAIEGTRLTYTFQLNKPVAKAELVATNESVSLALRENAIAMLPEYVLTNSARYTLALVDAEGRSNKFPADIVLQVLSNRPPDLKVIFPRGDQRVSRLEELQLKAEARGEFGLLKYGIGFGLAGQDPKFVELGQSAGHDEKRDFNYLIPFETLPIDEDQVLDYFVWADDVGPDGEVRRTFSDMFFAEVRPFEQAYRADQSGSSDTQSQGQGAGNAGMKLAEMQKEIVIATWKLRQGKPSTKGPHEKKNF
jgi:hypothetical protein